MTKAVLLPWSGGMDSTTLLIQHLSEKKYDHIYTMYIKLYGDKVDCELKTIEKLDSMICESVWTDEEIKWTHAEYQFDYPPCNTSEGIFQPPVWLVYAAFYAGDIATKHSQVDVNLGYVRGDCATREKSRIVAAWKGISGLTRMDGEPYNLEFPFMGMSKTHIYNRLKKYSEKYDKPFLDTAWVCEIPKKENNDYVRCGKCEPCKRDPRYKM